MVMPFERNQEVDAEQEKYMLLMFNLCPDCSSLWDDETHVKLIKKPLPENPKENARYIGRCPKCDKEHYLDYCVEDDEE